MYISLLYKNNYMSDSIMISSKVDKNTYDILSSLALSMKVSKTAVLKEAISKMQKNYIKEQIKQSYANLWDDKDSMDLAEMWISDFNSLYK